MVSQGWVSWQARFVWHGHGRTGEAKEAVSRYEVHAKVPDPRRAASVGLFECLAKRGALFVAHSQFPNQVLRTPPTFAQRSVQEGLAVVLTLKVKQFRNYALTWTRSDA